MEFWFPREALLELLAALRRLRRAARCTEAKMRFVLLRRKRLAPLADEQIRSYRRDGYLLASGLIPGHLTREAEAAMWECLHADAARKETWPVLGPQPHILREARLARTYTDALLAAAAQLSETDVAGFLAPTHV